MRWCLGALQTVLRSRVATIGCWGRGPSCQESESVTANARRYFWHFCLRSGRSQVIIQDSSYPMVPTGPGQVLTAVPYRPGIKRASRPPWRPALVYQIMIHIRFLHVGLRHLPYLQTLRPFRPVAAMRIQQLDSRTVLIPLFTELL